MKEKPEVLQGTLALMVLKILDVPGPRHGKHLHAETRYWNQTAAIIARFFEVKAEDLP